MRAPAPKMTLPIQPLLCGDSKTPNNNSTNISTPTTTLLPPLRGGGGGGGGAASTARRRAYCLSAAWADPGPSLASRRERRRAICSWSVGYGTLLNEQLVQEENNTTSSTTTKLQDLNYYCKKGKVADNASLLEQPRGRRHFVVTTTTSTATTTPTTVIAATHAPTITTATSQGTEKTETAQTVTTGGQPATGATTGGAGTTRHNRFSNSNSNNRSRFDLFGGMPGIRTLVNRSRRRNSHSDAVATAATTTSTAAAAQFADASTPLVGKSNGSVATVVVSGNDGSTVHHTLATTTTTTTTTTARTAFTKNPTNLIKPALSLANLRRCDNGSSSSTTANNIITPGLLLRSSSSSGSVDHQPLLPINRLRIPSLPQQHHQQQEGSSSNHSQFCSRCSSILTLASGSRYSLNSATGGFVPVGGTGSASGSDSDNNRDQVVPSTPPVVLLLCKLCLVEVPSKDACHIEECTCAFCAECMRVYVEFEIAQGAYDISCPDAQCPSKGVLKDEEIKRLAGNELFEKHKKYRLNREIELDKNRTWCPRAGCETVCHLCPTQQCQPQSVHCPSCTSYFCSNCKLEWHPGLTCEENNKRLAREGKAEEPGIPFDSDLIKCCPMCNVPIEKDEGCAQMMCKRCKHVFCWYCLASLDDDFLLRHYDKGPCKNKLGHSRASVIWHRTQVIGIFAGFGILLLVASPLLLLAAPCIVCCKCRFCNAGAAAATLANVNKLEEEEDEDEAGHDESRPMTSSSLGVTVAKATTTTTTASAATNVDD